MSSSNPGPVRRFFRGAWRVVDVSRRVVLNLIFMIIVIAVIIAFARSGPLPLADKTALVLRIDGTIGEQKTGNLRSTALDQVRGEAVQKVQLRDILNALDAAAKDPKIRASSLVLDDMTADRPRDAARDRRAIDRFKASGKKVVAWGSGYDQRQYYVAAHADEVYLHPLGMVHIAGFGSLPQLLQGRARQARRHRQPGARRHLQERGRAVHRQRAVAARRAKPTSSSTARCGRPTSTRSRRRASSPPGIAHARHRRPAGAHGRGRRRRRQARARREARRRPEDARRAARPDDRARREGRRREDLPPDLVRRLPRPRHGRSSPATRSASSSPKARSSTARAGRHGRRPVDRQPDPEGARRQGRQGASSCASIRPAAASSARAGPARARGDARGRQAGGRLDGQRRRLGRLLDLDRVRRDRRRRRRPSPARSACSRSCRPADKALDKLGIHPTGVTTTWLRGADDPRLPLDPRFADADPDEHRPRLRRLHDQASRGRARPRPRRSTRSPRAASGPARRRKERGLVDRIGSFGDALARRPSAPSSATTAIAYIERDAGQVLAAGRRCSTRQVAAPDRRARSTLRSAPPRRAPPQRRARRGARARLASREHRRAQKRRSRPSRTVSARDLTEPPTGRPRRDR